MLGAGQATGWAKKRVCYLCVMREIIMRPEIQRRHIFVSLPWQPLIFHVIFALPASLEVLLSVSPQRRKYFSPYIYTRSYPFLLSTQLPLWITTKLVNCDHERRAKQQLLILWTRNQFNKGSHCTPPQLDERIYKYFKRNVGTWYRRLESAGAATHSLNAPGVQKHCEELLYVLTAGSAQRGKSAFHVHI